MLKNIENFASRLLLGIAVPHNENYVTSVACWLDYGIVGRKVKMPRWKREQYMDASGAWRMPDDDYIDYSGAWRAPEDDYVDYSGAWRSEYDMYVDETGCWRRPGEQYVDHSGGWRW